MINGHLEKLTIISYKDNNYERGEELGQYKVLFNPEQLQEKVNIQYSGKMPKLNGNSDANLKFQGIDPKQFNLDLLFDGTGTLGFNGDVASQIKEFKEVALEMKSETHKPRPVEIIWGNFLFKGVLISLSITYSLFDAQGAPLRAKGKALFYTSISDKARVKKEEKSSPDLTHVRVVKAGDTLPLLTKDIYGSESYYLEVARFNKLKSFRSLTPGTKLYFPPLDKAS